MLDKVLMDISLGNKGEQKPVDWYSVFL